jgi:hypothetical protein
LPPAASAREDSPLVLLRGVEADEGAARVEERRENVGAALLAEYSVAVLAEPGRPPLDHPSIAAKSLARLDAGASDPRGDAERP